MLLPILIAALFLPQTTGPFKGRWPDGKRKIDAVVYLNEAEEVVYQGSYQTWHERGKRFEDGKYEHGIRVGKWTIRDEKGRLKERGHYVDGYRIGEWSIYERDENDKAQKRIVVGEFWSKSNVQTGTTRKGAKWSGTKTGSATMIRADGSTMLQVVYEPLGVADSAQ